MKRKGTSENINGDKFPELLYISIENLFNQQIDLELQFKLSIKE